MIAFPEDKIQTIINDIDKALDAGANPVAAFDADGTLWEHDAGEGFLEYQIQNKLLDLPADPWKHYDDMKVDQSPQAAYLWLAQINAGHPLETVRQWSKDCTGPVDKLRTFESQKAIIDHMHKKGVEVYVVTASIKWAVEPCAAFYNIDYDHVVGITTKIIDGKITAEQDGPITYKSGKVDGLLEKTGGKKPFFASGNSEGDLPLMESATHLRLAMASAPESEQPEMFKIEQEVVGIAKSNGWYYHSFV